MRVLLKIDVIKAALVKVPPISKAILSYKASICVSKYYIDIDIILMILIISLL